MSVSSMVAGALVADAASLGLHWLDDQDRLTKLAKAGPLPFRAPDKAAYEGVKGAFAHVGKRVGENSHYGCVLRLMARHLAAQGGRFRRQAWQSDYLAEFGPGGPYSGYIDRPMRQTLERLSAAGSPEAFPARSGANDDQLSALCVVPALVGRPGGADDSEIEAAVAVSHDHPLAIEAALVFATALRSLAGGLNIAASLHMAAMQAGEMLRPLLDEALAIPGMNSRGAAQRFGLSCPIAQGLPVAFHIARRALTFRDGVEENLLAGGDSCGRAIVIGALLPLEMKGRDGIPPDWLARLDPPLA